MEPKPPDFSLYSGSTRQEELKNLVRVNKRKKSTSGSETWGSNSESSSSFSVHSLEAAMDRVLSQKVQLSMPTPKVSTPRGRRGRKPLRPNDPIKKKTEEKDKYWLRAFRAYMKENITSFIEEMTTEERRFWEEHLGPKGKPEKGNAFLSYGKRYKDYLFSHQTFVYNFQKWFREYGEAELAKRCEPRSARWFVFYDYGEKELFYYTPKENSLADEDYSPLGSASPINSKISDDDKFDFYMVGSDNEEMVESFLNNL